MARNIQSDEKQGPTTKITLPRKAIIQNQRTDKELLRQEKAKEFISTRPVLYEMLESSSRRKERSKT